VTRRRAAAVAASVVLVVGLVVVSGVVPIAASSGHWRVTAAVLHFAMRRSVALHSLGQEVPALDDPWLAQKGAAHYDAACRDCHGSPGHPQPVIARSMTPAPPDLAKTVREWDAAELFYIVKHGVKFTGMPAWPARERDDEVWAMVAFLQRLPGLDAQDYRRLVSEDAPSGTRDVVPAAASACARCHGPDGRGRGSPAFPVLAGQRPEYLQAALQAYARGERHSGFMGPVAGGLDEEEMRELAVHYGGLPRRPVPRSPLSSAEATARGEEIARSGIPGQRVPACAPCHGPGDTPRHPFYPILAGQYSEYLVLQLELLRQDRRGGSPYARLMRPVVSRMTRQQMREVALYYESLGAGPTRGIGDPAGPAP
jgi:cytochrome c553